MAPTKRNIRFFVVAALLLTTSSLILGLLTLFAGYTNAGSTTGFMEYAAILKVCIFPTPSFLSPHGNN
jgi:hypothetical protein